MYKQAITLILAAISFTACTSPGRFPPAISLPSPSKPETTAKVTDFSARQWTFNFQNNARTYSSTSQTTFDSDSSNSIGNKDTISIRSQFTIAIDRLQTPASISGHIDSIIVQAGSRIGTDNRKINMPINFSGIIDSSQLVLNAIEKSSTFTTQTEDSSCNNPASFFLGEIRGGVVLLPTRLYSSSRWSDTISTVTCSGSTIPSRVEIIRFYQVVGERADGNTTTLLLKRTEHIHLKASGVQGQHQVKLEGEGIGSSNITLDPATGTALVIEVYQELKLTIISSGQSKRFIQRVKQRIALTS